MSKRQPIDATWVQDDPLAPMRSVKNKAVEKATANTALSDYAALGVTRSFKKLIEMYTASPPKRANPPTTSVDTLKHWSRRFDWQARIARYDELRIEATRLEWESRQDELRLMDWQQGADLREKVLDFLRELPKFTKTQVGEKEEIQPDGTKVITRIITIGLNTSLAQIAQSLRAASELQRLALGEPTQNINLSGAALDVMIERELGKLAEARMGGDVPALPQPS